MKAASVRPLQCVCAEGSTGGEAEPDLAGWEARQRGARRPEQPIARELGEHELTHTPYRDWCVLCTRGRGVSDRHARLRQAEDLGNAMATWSMDYCVLTDGDTLDGKEAAKYVLACHGQNI